MKSDRWYKIGQAAQILDTTTITLRYYEKIGLLEPSQYSQSGYRLYQQVDFEKFNLIKNAKKVGFQLSDIKELLLFLNNPQVSSAKVKAYISKKLQLVEQQLHSLKQIRQTLRELDSSCDGYKSADECPILKSLIQQK